MYYKMQIVLIYSNIFKYLNRSSMCNCDLLKLPASSQNRKQISKALLMHTNHMKIAIANLRLHTLLYHNQSTVFRYETPYDIIEFCDYFLLLFLYFIISNNAKIKDDVLTSETICC